MNVGEQFVYLNLDQDVVTQHRLRSRDIGLVINDAPVMVALDSQNHKHLLIPDPEAKAMEDFFSQGVVLRQRELLIEGHASVFIDLECTLPALDMVFERLLDDILERLEMAHGNAAVTCRQALDEWQALLRSATDGVTRDTVVGLVGELEVLRLLARHSPLSALRAWRGPTHSVHDFVRKGAALEVKATSSVDAKVVSISNIAQLDPSLVDQLHMAVVHVAEDETAPTMDERIDELVAMGIPRDALLKRVQDAGYVYEARINIEDRFAVRSVRVWRVDDDFPGLRRTEIPPLRWAGISDIRYKLHLDAAPGLLDEAEAASFWRDWADHVDTQG